MLHEVLTQNNAAAGGRPPCDATSGEVRVCEDVNDGLGLLRRSRHLWLTLGLRSHSKCSWIHLNCRPTEIANVNKQTNDDNVSTKQTEE